MLPPASQAGAGAPEQGCNMETIAISISWSMYTQRYLLKAEESGAAHAGLSMQWQMSAWCTVFVWQAPFWVQSAVQAHEGAVQPAVLGVDFCCSRPLHSSCSCLDMHGSPPFMKAGSMQCMKQPSK